MTFLDYYRENLDHIRGVASEFAVEFPKIAARLELSEQNCQDPYVERMLEGAAFLAARVEHKLDCGFPRLLETVLSSVSPLSVSPVPSYSVLRLDLDGADPRLKRQYRLPAGSAFHCRVDGAGAPCTFATLSETALHTAAVVDVRYLTREQDDMGLASAAALSVALSGVKAGVGSYDFYVDLPEGEASLLQGQLVGELEGVYVRRDGDVERLEGARVTVPAYEDRAEDGCGALHGLATLQRYFACPHLFKFLRVSGLGALPTSDRLELLFALRRRDLALARLMTPTTLRLNCVGVTNVFPRRADRTEYRGDFEHQVVPDRGAPRDYEVLRVLSVDAYGDRNQVLFTACNTYSDEQPDRFVPHRRQRLLHPGVSRSAYAGTEVYVSLAGPGYRSMRDQIRQLGARLLCTNADLPLLLRKETPLTPPSETPVAGAAFLVHPSAPRPPAMSAAAKDDWEKLSHLTLNLSSVLWKDDVVSVGRLRDLVRSYAVSFDEAAERLVDGIRGLSAVSRTFRFVRAGAVYFESGWEVHLRLDTTVCAGSGVFTFASVLKELLFAYVPLGSCVELVVDTDRRERAYVWRSQEA